MKDFRDKCIYAVAKEMARGQGDLSLSWGERTHDAIPAATAMVLKMNNLELLDLIGRVMDDNA